MRFYKILKINLSISMIDIIAYNQIYNIGTRYMYNFYVSQIMLNLDSMINYIAYL